MLSILSVKPNRASLTYGFRFHVTRWAKSPVQYADVREDKDTYVDFENIGVFDEEKITL